MLQRSAKTSGKVETVEQGRKFHDSREIRIEGGTTRKGQSFFEWVRLARAIFLEGAGFESAKRYFKGQG